MSAAQRFRYSGIDNGDSSSPARRRIPPPISLSIGGTVRRDDGAHKVDHGAWSTAIS